MVVETDVDLFNYAALYCCCCCKESGASDDQLDMEDRMHSERMPGSYSFPNWPSVRPFVRCLLGCLDGWLGGWPKGERVTRGLWPFAKTVYLVINGWLKVMSCTERWNNSLTGSVWLTARVRMFRPLWNISPWSALKRLCFSQVGS